MSESSPLERLLRRDRAITLFGVAFLCALAWLYILMGAGLGMNMWDMTRLALFPHLQGPAAMPDMAGMDMSGMDMSSPGADAMMADMAAMAWSPVIWALMIVMWWTMMMAMMLPSAAPAILLYGHVYRHAQAQGRIEDGLAPTGPFLAGYALLWLAFSIAATALHWWLERQGIMSSASMASQRVWLSGGVLVIAGLYQLSPFKNACLSQCRSPASFISRHWRPGAAGALRLGALHGAYCVGCCWALMLLLFVGGVMNLVWIAVLAVIILIEKLAPAGHWIGRAVGCVLILWGIATLLV